MKKLIFLSWLITSFFLAFFFLVIMRMPLLIGGFLSIFTLTAYGIIIFIINEKKSRLRGMKSPLELSKLQREQIFFVAEIYKGLIALMPWGYSKRQIDPEDDTHIHILSEEIVFYKIAHVPLELRREGCIFKIIPLPEGIIAFRKVTPHYDLDCFTQSDGVYFSPQVVEPGEGKIIFSPKKKILTAN